MDVTKWSDEFKNTVFGCFYVLLAFLVASPIVFSWSNRIEPWVLGLPFVYFWQILIISIWIITFWVHYWVESVRGDLDVDIEPVQND